MFSVPFLSSRKTSSSRRNRSSGMSRRAFEPRRIRVEPLEDRRLLAVVSHWPADGTAADAVGDNDATLVSGADYSLGQIGQAFLFDGVDDRALVADHPSLALTDSMTIEAWIRVDSFPDPGEGSGWIVFRGDERGGLDPYTMGVQSDRSLKFEINGAPGAAAISTPIPQGEILHVAATLDDATGDMSIYVNGVQMGHTITNVRPFADLDPASNPGIGIGISRFHGMIDELKIHNVALSEPGILGIYNAGKGDLQAEISINDVSVTEGDSGVQLVDDFVTPPAGDLHEARTIAFGPQGDLFVASSFPPQVLRYDGATGAYEGVFANAQNGGPDQRTGSLVFDANYLYVSNAGGMNSVLRFDAATGAPAPAPGQTGAVFVAPGVGEQEVDGPYGMTIGPDGNLYVSNNRRDDVTRYDISTGARIDVFVAVGSGGLDQPAGLFFDDAGRLCVASSGTHEILRYQGPNGSSPGDYLDVLIPSQSGGLDFPSSMVVGPEGDLYVNSRDSNQVLRYDMESGAFLESIAVARPGSLLAPKGITFDANGVLYVTSSAGEQVLRSAPKSYAVVHVDLSMPVPETVTVDFTTADGTALAGADYSAASGIVTFAPGETSKVILVPTVDDIITESEEYFSVNLSNPTGGAVINDPQGIATILDTDGPLFSDSFEHGQWNGLWVEDSQNDWFTSTQRKTDGSYSAEVDGAASDAKLSLASPIDLTPYGSAELSFDWLIESGLDTGEYLALDLFNGAAWQEVARLRGNVDAENTWHHEVLTVDGGYLVSNFQFRFRAKMSGSDEDANLDNVQLVATSLAAPNVPPVADIGGPYSGSEGTAITLDASASHDPDGAIASYDWDLDNDGQYDDASGVTTTFTRTADGTYTIGLRVTDNRGDTDTASTSVTVANVAPTADAGGPYTTGEGVDVTLSAAGSTDPGNDIASYAWDLDGDGQYDDATGVTATFNSPTEGTFTVAVKVTDDDGASATHEALVNVVSSVETVVFSDSFEAGQWNGKWVEDSQNDWFTSTQRATAGNYSAEVDGRATNATLSMSNAVDLTAYGSAELTFDWYIESSFDAGEYLALDFSPNGSTWTEIRRLRGNVDTENTWHTETIQVGSAYLTDGFKIRFRAYVSGSDEDANVDNVQLVAGGMSSSSASTMAAGLDASEELWQLLAADQTAREHDESRTGKKTGELTDLALLEWQLAE